MQSPTDVLFDGSLYFDFWAALQDAAIPDMTPEGEQTGKGLNRYARTSANVFFTKMKDKATYHGSSRF